MLRKGDAVQKISVIMPVYNTETAYLKGAIDSILNQTYKNIELIVVDDGSVTDSVFKVVDSYDDKRLVYLNQGHNGAGPARNIGIKAATGDWIYIMASDDVLDRDAFEISMGLIKLYNPDIVLFNLAGGLDDGSIQQFHAPVSFLITNAGDTT